MIKSIFAPFVVVDGVDVRCVNAIQKKSFSSDYNLLLNFVFFRVEFCNVSSRIFLSLSFYQFRLSFDIIYKRMLEKTHQ